MALYNKLLILAVVVCGLAWYLHTPIPVNFSEPWKLRLQLGISKVLFDVAWVLDQLHIMPLYGTLRTMNPNNLTTPEHIYINDITIEGISIRLYGNSKKSKDLPGLVFYHGGGWVMSSPEMYDGVIIEIASAMDITILSVDYRMAPEVIFPGPFEDCVKVTKFILENARKYDLNPHRIAIGGDSAGGNLAAAVALKLRDDNFTPMPKAQVLVYPVLQAHDFSLPSYTQNKDGPLLTKHLMLYLWSMYISGTTKYVNKFMTNEHTTPAVKRQVYDSYIHHEDIEMDYNYHPYMKPALDFGDAATWSEIKDVLSNPYLSPLIADDVSGLPGAYVFTAHYDVLRDDGLLYVKRLRKASVPVTHEHGAHAFHGVFGLQGSHFKEGRMCMDSIIKYLIENL